MPTRRSPRVLQVVLSLHPGGTERLVLELATRLHDECPMAVCCLDDPGPWATELVARGIVVMALRRSPGFRPSLARDIAAACRAHGATIAHAHHYSPFVYSALARVTASGARIVFTEHGRLSDAGPSSKRRLANRVLASLADASFAVSEDVKAHMVAEGFGRDDVGVIYNGIDVGAPPDAAIRRQIRESLGAGEGTCVVGTIARLDPVKDLGTLVRAAAVVARDRDVKLVIVGGGPQEADLAAIARTLDIASRVQFPGYRADARAWLAGFDVYANSSISEGVSLTILEAMAAGLPVVATAVGGTREVLDDTCGLLVPPRNAEALAAAIAAVATDPTRAGSLGAGGRARVERHFTIERMVRDYHAVYERLTSD